MTNQERAQDLADALHEVERLQRELRKATKALHDKMACHATDCGLGLDITPLSAGGNK